MSTAISEPEYVLIVDGRGYYVCTGAHDIIHLSGLLQEARTISGYSEAMETAERLRGLRRSVAIVRRDLFSLPVGIRESRRRVTHSEERKG